VLANSIDFACYSSECIIILQNYKKKTVLLKILTSC